MRFLSILAIIGLLAVLPTPASAEVGDPVVATNHPQYPGEGAFQTIEQCATWPTADKKSAQDKAIALYLWMLTHQFHLHSPKEWCVPGKAPDAKNSDQEMIVYDANRARFSYGYGLCGTVHAWNEPYWKALGMNARRRAFPGHTNSEIFYGGAWHAFDTDMAGLVFRPDGVVAGYDDIIKNPKLIDIDRSPLPRYPFAWPSDFRGMKSGWQQVAKRKKWYKLYNAGYAAQPGIVRLRSGETFTRYFDRDHFGGPSKRRFWHNQPGGPFRDWTFVNKGTPEHRGSKSNSRGNASYCNGEFIYRPGLGRPSFQEGVASQVNIASNTASPILHSKDGKQASVTFDHFSPYVIAGDPADDANPMTKPATGGLVISGNSVGPVEVSVSADQGQTWSSSGKVKGNFTKDVTDLVKGRYGWQVRFTWQGKGGLDDVAFTTVTQVAQPIYPRLKPNGCQVVYRAGSRGVAPVLPNWSQPEQAIAKLEAKPLRSSNLTYTPRSPKARRAYTTRNNKPAWVVFKVDAPSNLLQVNAAARFTIRVPPPKGCDFRLDVSTDQGKTWKPMGKAEMAADNEFSSGWVYGKADISAARVKSALVRVHLHAGGYTTGLVTAEAYGIYETPAPQPVQLTYAWKEKGKVRTHSEMIPAGAKEHRFKVPTGANITDEFIRFSAN